MERLVTTKEAGEILKVSDARVRQLIRQGRLPAEKTGRDLMIKITDLEGVKNRKHGRPESIDGRPALICLDGYAGYREHPVTIIGETRTKYRIAVTVRTKMAGRNRWLDPGETALVPKSAVKFTEETECKQ